MPEADCFALSSQGGHSAQVKMRLLINGVSVPVVQMGPDFLLVDQPLSHPPGPARLSLAVDKNERLWHVHLPHGMSATSKRVAITSVSVVSRGISPGRFLSGPAFEARQSVPWPENCTRVPVAEMRKGG
jgi:hypothetical protein